MVGVVLLVELVDLMARMCFAGSCYLFDRVICSIVLLVGLFLLVEPCLLVGSCCVFAQCRMFVGKSDQFRIDLFVQRCERFCPGRKKVKSVFIVHVGGTRCVTSSTANNMKIHARITLTVEFIRTCIFLFLFDMEIQ